MNSKTQCHAIVSTFGKRWFTTLIVTNHLEITSLHRRLSDLEAQGYIIQRVKAPKARHKIYRITGRINAAA